MKKTVLIALVVVFAACEQAEPEVAEVTFPAAVQEALGSIEFSRRPNATMADLRAGVEAATASMEEIAVQASDWRDAHAMAQEMISEAPVGVVRGAVEQAVAKLLLAGYLVPNQTEDGASDLALEYAELLVERRSPEAETVLKTVEAFGSTWEDADRRAVALGAAEAVESHVEGGSLCRDCDLPEEARRALAESGQSSDVVSLRRLRAAERLRELAG